MPVVLVVGATGRLGGEACGRLRAGGAAVRALVRASPDRAQLDRLRELGVEIVAGDLKDPASLPAACDSADAIVSTAKGVPRAW